MAVHCRASLVLMNIPQVEQKCEGEIWIEELALCQLWVTVTAHSISLFRSVVKMRASPQGKSMDAGRLFYKRMVYSATRSFSLGIQQLCQV